MPEYSGIARQARIEGTLSANIKLGPAAEVKEVAAPEVSARPQLKLLLPSVEYALRKSQFRRDCAGKELVLVFEFRITGDPYDGVQKEFAFGYPNRFAITSRPAPPLLEH